jgi:hypothetical protein
MAVGKLFSVIRDRLGDRTLRRERSYRATLIGLRHGVDLVQLMLDVARQAGHAELVSFFEHWLSKRTPLVEAVARELQWFAERPSVALEVAKGISAGTTNHDANRAAE